MPLIPALVSWRPAWSIASSRVARTIHKNPVSKMNQKKKKRDHTQAEESKVSPGLNRAQFSRPRRAEIVSG